MKNKKNFFIILAVIIFVIGVFSAYLSVKYFQLLKNDNVNKNSSGVTIIENDDIITEEESSALELNIGETINLIEIFNSMESIEEDESDYLSLANTKQDTQDNEFQVISYDNSILSIDDNGNAIALSEGETLVKFTISDNTYNLSILVSNANTSNATVPSISFYNPLYTVSSSSNKSLIINTTLYVGGSASYSVKATGSGVKCSSSNKTVATTEYNEETNACDVKAISAGTAIIKAYIGSVSTTVSVNVIKSSGNKIHYISQLPYGIVNNITYAKTGDAILLETNGKFALIDGGDTTGYIVDSETRTVARDNLINYLKALNVTELEFVLFTHMDSDHAGNFNYLLDELGIKVKTVYIKEYPYKNSVSETKCYNNNKSIEIDGKKYNTTNAQCRYNSIINKTSHIDLVTRILSFTDSGLSFYSVPKKTITTTKLYNNTSTFKYNSNLGDYYYFFSFGNFNLKLFNVKQNSKAYISENYNSIATYITVNGHSALLTGDFFDTEMFNKIAKTVSVLNGGKIDIFQVPHHGSHKCALLTKNDSGIVVTSGGVKSTALDDLKPSYYVVTSSEKKIAYVRGDTAMCMDVINQSSNIKYVDTSSKSLVIDLTNSSKITFTRY